MNKAIFIRAANIAAFAGLIAVTGLSAGCGPKGDKPSGVEAQQKGVMGGTPPPGEMAKIQAERARQEQISAAEQAKGSAAAAAAAQGGK